MHMEAVIVVVLYILLGKRSKDVSKIHATGILKKGRRILCILVLAFLPSMGQRELLQPDVCLICGGIMLASRLPMRL